jgi:hypothetical protein
VRWRFEGVWGRRLAWWWSERLLRSDEKGMRRGDGVDASRPSGHGWSVGGGKEAITGFGGGRVRPVEPG